MSPQEHKNPKSNFPIKLPLHKAAQNGHFKVCHLIMENVKDKNQITNPRDHRGNTPLHIAADKGHLNVCRLIIQNVQVINPRNEYGWTPLHEAAQIGNFECPSTF